MKRGSSVTVDGEEFLIVREDYSYRAMPWKRAKALPPPDNTLFDACFRLQREASAAAGRHIPMVVENVKGAQKWVGRARWHYGSYYLWGDVPALMPPATARKVSHGEEYPGQPGNPRKGDGGSWFGDYQAQKAAQDGIKQGGEWWHDPGSLTRRFSSRSLARKAASAQIAKIPFPLAQHIARVFKPEVSA